MQASFRSFDRTTMREKADRCLQWTALGGSAAAADENDASKQRTSSSRGGDGRPGLPGPPQRGRPVRLYGGSAGCGCGWPSEGWTVMLPFDCRGIHALNDHNLRHGGGGGLLLQRLETSDDDERWLGHRGPTGSGHSSRSFRLCRGNLRPLSPVFAAPVAPSTCATATSVISSLTSAFPAIWSAFPLMVVRSKERKARLQRPCVSVRVAICGCLWLFVAVCGNLWQRVAICGSFHSLVFIVLPLHIKR